MVVLAIAIVYVIKSNTSAQSLVGTVPQSLSTGVAPTKSNT